MRKVAQTLFRLAPRGEITEEANNTADVALCIPHTIELQPLGIEFATLARLNQLTLPPALLLQGLVNRRQVPPRVAAAGQLQHVARQQLFSVVAGDSTECLIDGQQHVIRVENGNTFAGSLEHCGRQALLLFLSLACADVAPCPQHTHNSPVGIALDGPATVLDPAPMALAVTNPVLDTVILGAPLQMLDQRALERRQVVGVQARLEVSQHRLDLLWIKAKQLAKLGVVNLIALQVPVP